MKKLMYLAMVALLFAAGGANAALFDVWHDTDYDGVRDTYLGTVSDYTGGITSVANYGFSSASAHPVNGPTPEAYKSKMYMYTGSDGLSFGMFHNVDAGGNNYWNHVRTHFQFQNMTSAIGLVDDNTPEGHGEIGVVQDDPFNYRAGWAYIQNTDGVVFNDLNATAWDWEIYIDPVLFGDVQEWGMYSADGSYISLWNNPMGLPDGLTSTDDYYGDRELAAYGAVITPHAIPEPGTMLLLGMGLLGSGFAFRRRRK